jgi:hypothetical protein
VREKVILMDNYMPNFDIASTRVLVPPIASSYKKPNHLAGLGPVETSVGDR